MYHMVQFSPMAGKDPRGKLLNAAIDHIAARGISDLSLRELAAAIGTSHRMLIHHFGSREALWVEVIRAVEARQRALLAEVLPDPEATAGDVMRQWWIHISDESLWANERLFFEVYGQALQGRPGTVELLDGLHDRHEQPLAPAEVVDQHAVAGADGGRELAQRQVADAALGDVVDRGVEQPLSGVDAGHDQSVPSGTCPPQSPSPSTCPSPATTSTPTST